MGTSANGVARQCAERANQVWCYDFVHDQTADGRPLKFLAIEDEYTRESLAIEVSRSLTSRDVIARLQRLFAQRGAPQGIRSDSEGDQGGSPIPEFIAQALQNWLATSPEGTLYIDAGAPWQNGHAESFHGKLRDELLNAEQFMSVLEAKVLSEQLRVEFNEERPHSALGYLTQAEFARRLRAGSATLRRPAAAEKDGPSQTLIRTGT